MVRRDPVSEVRSQVIINARYAESMLRDAVFAALERDAVLARVVADADRRLDLEFTASEKALAAVIAETGPDGIGIVRAAIVAEQATERIGELASNIARRSLEIGPGPDMEIAPELQDLSIRVLRQMAWAIAAVEAADDVAARAVRDHDADTDRLNRAVFRRMIAFAESHPADIERALAWTSISRYLERVADHAVRLGGLAIPLAGRTVHGIAG